MKLSVGSDVLSVVPSSSEGVFPPSFGDSDEHISVQRQDVKKQHRVSLGDAKE